MKLRHSLAVALVCTVAAPVALCTAAPALAAGTVPAQTRNQPTYEELQATAAAAAKAHTAAVAAAAEGRKEVEATLKALDSPEHPLKAAEIAAEKAAKAAASAKNAADERVTKAKAELEAAEGDAEKAAAQQTLTAAEADLATAVKNQQTADAELEKADTAVDDARVAASRKYGQLTEAVRRTAKDLETADTALAAAKECVRENGLTALAEGLPSKLVAGSTVGFTLRVTNGTERTLDVDPLVFLHATGEGAGAKNLLKTEWADGTAWRTLSADQPEHIGRIESLPPRGHQDVKMRLTIDPSARKTAGLALLAGDASDAYNPCVLGPMKRYDLEVLPAGSTPGKVDDAKPGTPGKTDDPRPTPANTPAPQGGTSTPTITPTPTSTPTGALASTGASTTLPLTLASATALTLGAAAFMTTRRRKPSNHA
ncbi:hypothetical protein [Streptomyces sp. NPDC002176]|uniref:hypothetical protein n=1 Tax=Streptomyces sp. NPDC002176 TaxID=3364634 RepID=UPI00384F7D1F